MSKPEWSDNLVFQWNDLLVAEFAGYVSNIKDEKELPNMLVSFKWKKTIEKCESVIKNEMVLKTADGYEIFDGEQWVYYSKKYNINKRKAKNATGLKAYANEENLRKWIVLHKPIFNLSEIHEAIFSEYAPTAQLAFDKLKDLAEEKIKHSTGTWLQE